MDPGQFEAAVLNLVGNARDAMQGEGRIIIATRNVEIASADGLDLVTGHYVRVTISDNGSGMDQDAVTKAVEPFFTTKEAGKGTGLGLSQVYGFVRQAGGSVGIISAVGKGTTVELIMPRCSEGLAFEQPAEEVRSQNAVAGGVVLIVEDEPNVLAAGVENLRDLGYATIAASDARSALEQLGIADRVDILFSDIIMPGGMDGLQLSEAARRLQPTIKVLLTTGYAHAAAAPFLTRMMVARLTFIFRATAEIDIPAASWYGASCWIWRRGRGPRIRRSRDVMARHSKPRALHRLVRRAARRAGLVAVSPHWLRHAHASHALDHGAPPHVVQQTLGHASLATITRYLHVHPGDCWSASH